MPRPPQPRSGAGRPRRRLAGRALALVALVAVVVAGVALVRGDGDDASPGRAGALRAPEDVALDGPPQQALGGLPAPAGADHVDLSRPASLGLHLPSPPAAGVAFDLADGRLLWRRSATRRRSIASLTKIMTALLSVERLRPDELVRVPRAADQIGGSRMGGLKPGRHVRAEVLLHGLLISSGNDAAVSLAMAAEGSVKAFTAVMNRRARQLGLTCTHYVDPHGLDPRDRSCARDLARLSMYAMAQPRIERIARKPYARVWPGSGRKLTLRSTNPLLRQRYPGTIGLKTGFTNPAGRCLVAVVQRGGRRIGMVLLGAPDPATDAMSLVRASVRRGVLPRAL